MVFCCGDDGETDMDSQIWDDFSRKIWSKSYFYQGLKHRKFTRWSAGSSASQQDKCVWIEPEETLVWNHSEGPDNQALYPKYKTSKWSQTELYYKSTNVWMTWNDIHIILHHL